LLIVVAIIAILAAIAVPNFLEAQTRSKVSRVRAEMRTVATALEAYAVDNGHYPFTVHFYEPSPLNKLVPLTSPISYITAVPRDPFSRTRSLLDDVLPPEEPRDIYMYNTGVASFGVGSNPAERSLQMQWSLTSAGPDLELEFPYYAFSPTFIESNRYLVFVYDPTNGTVSRGEILKRGGLIPYNIPGVPE
jgi:type II secretory pathway pseudopilin PulG